jgi:hypothetical protein
VLVWLCPDKHWKCAGWNALSFAMTNADLITSLQVAQIFAFGFGAVTAPEGPVTSILSCSERALSDGAAALLEDEDELAAGGAEFAPAPPSCMTVSRDSCGLLTWIGSGATPTSDSMRWT